MNAISSFRPRLTLPVASKPMQGVSSQGETSGFSRTQRPGLGQLQDGFDAGPQRGAELQALIQGTQALLQTLTALSQLLQTPQAGGAQAAPGASSTPGAGSSCSGSSFTPSASTPAPVELNPSSPSPESGASAPSASNSGSSVGESSASGEAKLGPGMPPALAQYKGAIEDAASKAGVPAAMIAGQIWQESRGNLAAVSTNGGNGLTDTGLMQVNPNTFKELQAKHPELQGKNLSDPATNIMAGAFYMKDMKEQFGSWDLALRAYNSGPNGVDRSNPNAIPAGTGDATYVQKVKQFWDTISTGKGSLPA